MIQLNQFIPASDFSNPVFQIGWELWLPTEVVIAEPKIVTPQVARVYKTRHLVVGNQLIQCDDAQKTIPDFKGIAHYPYVHLWEVWIDWGSDGHIHYQLEGFVFLSTEKQLPPEDNKYPDNIQDWYWDYRHPPK